MSKTNTINMAPVIKKLDGGIFIKEEWGIG
jgi:hypothetical protein